MTMTGKQPTSHGCVNASESGWWAPTIRHPTSDHQILDLCLCLDSGAAETGRLWAESFVDQLRGRRLPGPPGSTLPRPSPLKGGRDLVRAVGRYSHPPFGDGVRAREPGGAASLRAWRSWRH